MLYRAAEQLRFRISEKETPWRAVNLPRGTILVHLPGRKTRQSFLIPTGEIAYAEGWSLQSLLDLGLIELVEERCTSKARNLA